MVILSAMTTLLRQLGRNIFSSWASLGVRVVVVFLVNPFIIHTLGNERYGVWVLVLSIINYMTMMDFGIKQALLRFISKYLGEKDFNRINSLLKAAFFVYFSVALLVIIITFVLSFFALDWFNISGELMSRARWALIIIGISTALNFAFIAWSESLGAFHRYDIFYALTIAEDILRTAAVIVVLKLGYGLVWFALCFLVFNLVRNLAAAGILRKLFPGVRMGGLRPERAALRTLMGYGMVGFFISFAWLMIANTDNVLIGYFLSASDITQYAIAAGFIAYLRTLVLAVSFPLRPVISHFEANRNFESIRRIYLIGSKYLFFLTFMAAGLALGYADNFITLWLGPGYEPAAEILTILIVPAALFLPQTVAASILYGIEKHKYLLYLILAEGFGNLILSIILVKNYGLAGIAYGTIVPQVIIYLMIMPAMIRKFLDFDLRKYYGNIVRYGLAALILAYLTAFGLNHLWPAETWPRLAVGVTLAVVVTTAIGYIGCNRGEVRFILDKFRLK